MIKNVKGKCNAKQKSLLFKRFSMFCLTGTISQFKIQSETLTALTLTSGDQETVFFAKATNQVSSRIIGCRAIVQGHFEGNVLLADDIRAYDENGLTITYSSEESNLNKKETQNEKAL